MEKYEDIGFRTIPLSSKKSYWNL